MNDSNNIYSSLRKTLAYLPVYKMSSGLYVFILKSPLFYTTLEVCFEKNLEKHDCAITKCYEIALIVHVHTFNRSFS